MQQEALLPLPQPTDPLSSWENYLLQSLQRKSGCRVRASRLGETPVAREQQYLHRLATAARNYPSHAALAETVPVLQKRALELIQLRRQVIPDDSPVWNQAEVFLAVAELHRSVHRLLDQMERLQNQHQQLHEQLQLWHSLREKLIRGVGHDSTEIVNLVRQIRTTAADEAISPAVWIDLCWRCAEYENHSLAAFQRKAVASALQTPYLAAKVLQIDAWQIETDPLMGACLFKDLAWFLPAGSEKLRTQGHHGEWGAGLILQAFPHSASLPRLIRQHHECLDGTGLPFGLNVAQLRRDARLLSLLTRWTELYMNHCDSLEALDSSALQIPSEILVPECLAGRWDGTWLAILHQSLGLPVPTALPNPTQGTRNANPHWHVPRPHFLKKPFPVLPAKSRSSD